MKREGGHIMRIDMEKLFWTVYNHHCEISEYHRVRLRCWEKQYGNMKEHGWSPKNTPLNVSILENKDACEFTYFCERSRCGDSMIGDFCDVLGIDPRKLCGLSKSIRKWYEKRKWHGSFPFDKNYDRIYKYLRKE